AIIMEEASGWPLRCAYWCIRSGTAGPAIRRGWDLSGKGASPAYANITTVLPLAPIWAGLTIDAGLYGALVWCVSFGPLYPLRAVRRALRSRTGMCRQCGYDLQGLDVWRCPECGAE